MDQATADRMESGKQHLGSALAPKEPTSTIGVASRLLGKRRFYPALTKSINAHRQWMNNQLQDNQQERMSYYYTVQKSS